jgi:hypothetical protein
MDRFGALWRGLLSAIRRQSVRETAALWQVVVVPSQPRMYYHLLER